MKKKRILVSGGGTGGHIFPLLEVIKLLEKRRKVEIVYVGGKGNMEEEIVPKKYNFMPIQVGKLRRQITFLHFRDAIRVARGIARANIIVNKFKPHLIFCKGGYVSLPIILAGSAHKIPIITHESDVVLGLTNKIAVKFAKKICTGFPLRYYDNLDPKKAVYTGIPVNNDYFKKCTKRDKQLFSLKKELPVILICGGSQGSYAINCAVKPLLMSLLYKTQIIHMTGNQWIGEFNGLKNSLPKTIRYNYHPFDFLIKQFPSAVKCADLVVGRAGGSSTAEFSAAGVPMILIPYPSATAGHQVKNAEVYSKEGAAITIRERYLTATRLHDTINTLLQDKYRLKHLSLRAKAMSNPDSADKIVRVIEEQLKKYE